MFKFSDLWLHPPGVQVDQPGLGQCNDLAGDCCPPWPGLLLVPPRQPWGGAPLGCPPSPPQQSIFQPHNCSQVKKIGGKNVVTFYYLQTTSIGGSWMGNTLVLPTFGLVHSHSPDVGSLWVQLYLPVFDPHRATWRHGTPGLHSKHCITSQESNNTVAIFL